MAPPARPLGRFSGMAARDWRDADWPLGRTGAVCQVDNSVFFCLLFSDLS